MRLLIVSNGTIENPEWYSPMAGDFDKIIAADGGADNCMKLNIVPDFIIGDMDSISENAKRAFEGRSEIIHDPDQDKTDLQLAVRLANSLKPERIRIIGAIGRRMDHTISNIMALTETEAESEIVDENNIVRVVEDSLEITGRKGDIVSVVALSDVKGLSYEGLKWEVKNRNLPSGWTGICNEMTGVNAKVTLRGGKIVVIKAKDD